MMDFSIICRSCLGRKCLNPIFKSEEDHSPISTAVYIATGLKVRPNDGLPQNMCKNCMILLNNTLNFRKLCKDNECQLLAVKYSKENYANKSEELNILHTVPLKRKRCKDSTNSNKLLNIKIERELLELDEEIPLQSLLEKLTDNEHLKLETSDIKNVKIENYKTDDFDKLNKVDLNISSTQAKALKTNEIEIEDNADLKYETEYLDPHFDTNYEGDPNDMYVYIKEFDEINEKSLKKSIKQSIKKESNLDNNLFLIHNSNRVTCKLCQKELSKRSIDSHIAKRHPGADTRKVKCDLCDTYILQERLNRHKIVMHGRDCFRCGYCKTEFDSKEVLVDHVVSCTAKNKKRKPAQGDKRKVAMIECDVCQKVMQRASLKMHKEIKHAGMGPVCDHCGRRFGNKFRLLEHLRAKHGYEKYKCTVCPFASASAMAIRNHERRHRGEKPFVCETCGAKFHAASLLAQHKQSHRANRDMRCDQCPAAFKANNALHMHKMTCHSVNTYQCTMCPRTYSCRHYVVKHLRNVHRYSGPVGELHQPTVTQEIGQESGGTGASVVAIIQRIDEDVK